MNSLNQISKKTGLSQKMIFWFLVSFVSMITFTALFTYPQNRRIKQLDLENTIAETRLKEVILFEMLNAKLNNLRKETYPDLDRINAEPFEEEMLLELPARFEQLAYESGVAMVSIDPQSVDDGAEVSISVTFQGDMHNLYNLIKRIGLVKYVKTLETMSILALPDAEQMKLEFRVPIK